MRALVTGGTGRIGVAITARLEDTGWSVLAAGRADGDVARPDVARTLVDRAAAELGGIDLLVNGAAEGFAPKSALELTEADWDLAFGATAKGSFFVPQAAAPHLRESGGTVVMIGETFTSVAFGHIEGTPRMNVTSPATGALISPVFRPT